MADRPTVLFLCTGNSARSQMAEALLRARAGDAIEVCSAGTAPAEHVHPLAIDTMAERGLDCSGHHPKTIDAVVAARNERPIELAVTVCGHARETCPHFPGALQQVHIGFDDPAAATGSEDDCREVFRRVALEIEASLDQVIATLDEVIAAR